MKNLELSEKELEFLICVLETYDPIDDDDSKEKEDFLEKVKELQDKESSILFV